MQAIILIERYLPSSFFWTNMEKNKRIKTLSVEDVLIKYKGFEGELVSFFEPTESEVNALEILKLQINKKRSGNSILLHVVSDEGVISSSLKKLAVKVGYEVGVCAKEKTIYSSIFNEILFGHIDELIYFKDSLNNNLLFPDEVLAERYVKLHNQLAEQNRGVEDYEEMKVYEIWRYNTRE